MANNKNNDKQVIRRKKGTCLKSMGSGDGDDVPIFGLTGHRSADYRQKYLDSDMKNILENPISMSSLRNLLFTGSVILFEILFPTLRSSDHYV